MSQIVSINRYPMTASQLKGKREDVLAINTAIAGWTALQNSADASKHQLKRCKLEKCRLYRLVQKLGTLDSFFPGANIVPLSGGLSNANYKVMKKGITFFARQSELENVYLNTSLEKEYQALKAAGDVQIAPKVFLYSSRNGVLVTEYIETVGKGVNMRDPKQQRQLCDALRTLHSLPLNLPGKICPFEAIEHYLKYARDAEASIPEMVENELMPLILHLKETMPESLPVPCHNDLHAGNCMDDGKKLWLIDWEYAAMGDPLFDLATLASVEKFNDDEVADLLSNYLQKAASVEEIDSFRIKCALADARWGAWYLMQSKVSNIPFNYFEAGVEHMERSIARLKYKDLKCIL